MESLPFGSGLLSIVVVCNRYSYAQGLYPFAAPLGYLNNGKGKPKTIDPVTGPYVRTLFELYATGEYSLDALVRTAKQRGFVNKSGNPISRNCIDRMLTNPFYKGLIFIKRRGETYTGVHEPLISNSLFKQVEAARTSRNRPKDTRHKYLYRGMFKCAACKRTLTAEKQYKFIYYRCHNRNCTFKTIREDRLEQLIRAALAKIAISGTEVERLNNQLAHWLSGKTQEEIADPLPMQLKRIKDLKDKTTDALIDGLLDEDSAKRKLNRLCESETAVQEKQRNQDNKVLKIDTIRKMFEILKNPYFTYSSANETEKRQLLKIVSSKLDIRAEKLEIEPRDWVEQCHNLAFVLLGAPDADTLRSDKDLGKDEIHQLLELTECQYSQALISLHQTIKGRINAN